MGNKAVNQLGWELESRNARGAKNWLPSLNPARTFSGGRRLAGLLPDTQIEPESGLLCLRDHGAGLAGPAVDEGSASQPP